MTVKKQNGIAFPWLLVIILLIAVAFLAYKLYLQGGMVPPDTGEIPDSLKGQAEAFIGIPKNPEAPFFITDAEGNKIKGCKTCTPGRAKKYGEGCTKAPAEANICKPMKPMTPIQVRNITIFELQGSRCLFFYPSGGERVGYPPGCTL